MPSYRDYRDLTYTQGSGLTTGFGNGTTGWMTDGYNLAYADFDLLEFDYLDNASGATEVEIRFMLAQYTDRVDPTKFIPSYDIDSVTRNLVVDNFKLPVAGADGKFTLKFNSLALSFVALSAKADVAGGILTVRHLPSVDMHAEPQAQA